MDSKESLPSTTVAAAAALGGKDASIEEEGGTVSDKAGLARKACILFQSRRYAECIEVLNQLRQKANDDPKVIHNIAVAKYFKDGCSDPKELLKVLSDVQRRSEELQAAGMQMESMGNLGNNTSGSRGSGTGQTVSSANITYTDGFDTSTVIINKAIVMYHLHEYDLALSLLEPLYQNLEPLDEKTALQVCLLLLDIALASQDASRAANVIQYIETAFGLGSMNSGDYSNLPQHSSNINSKLALAPTVSTAPDASTSDGNQNVNTSENPPAAVVDDTIEYETLISTLGDDNGNPQQSLNDVSRTSINKAAGACDLKLKLQLYKVRLLLLTRNLKAAKREVKQAMNIARGKDSSTALLMKSQLEYLRGNHRKSLKLLMTSSNKSDAGTMIMLNNNLGCIYHWLKKHQCSTVLFSKSLRCNSSALLTRPLKLTTFAQDKSLLIVYNCGLQYLAGEKPLMAARCFYNASSLLSKKPLLWLRLAECCLLASEKGLMQPDDPVYKDTRIKVVGYGKLRNLVLHPGSTNRTSHIVSQDGLIGDDQQHRLSIPFAKQCLLNALHLLDTLDLKSPKLYDPDLRGSISTSLGSRMIGSGVDCKDPKGSSNTVLQSSVSTYESLLGERNQMLKQVVLANLAYVELCLENPLKALWASRRLQQLSSCSRLYVFLGRVYAAEALCRLNRLTEAAEQLEVFLSDNGVELPYGEESREKSNLRGGDSDDSNASNNSKRASAQYPQGGTYLRPDEARGYLYVNLAAMFAMQGDLEQADHFIREAQSIIPNNPRALLAEIYLDVLRGRTQDAVAKLKRCSHVRFFSSTESLSS